MSLKDINESEGDTFWKWAESRICKHTQLLCDDSIKKICSSLVASDGSDMRVPIVLTQSTYTVSRLSPFDRLEQCLHQKATRSIRLRGSESPTLVCVQEKLIAEVLGAKCGTVPSYRSSRVSLHGLDSTFLDDVLGRSMVYPMVVILEEGDSLEKASLLDLIRLVYIFDKKLRDYSSGRCGMSLVIESELGEALIEEAVAMEELFLDIRLVRIALISSEELDRAIRTIFVGSDSEAALFGFPFQVNAKDLECLRDIAPRLSVSSAVLCMSFKLLVFRFFRTCEFAFSGSLFTASDSGAQMDRLASTMAQPGVAYELSNSILKHGLFEFTLRGRKGFAAEAFLAKFQELQLLKQRLGVVKRFLFGLAAAMVPTGGRPGEVLTKSVENLTIFQTVKSAAEEKSLTSSIIPNLIDRVVEELQASLIKGRRSDSDTVCVKPVQSAVADSAVGVKELASFLVDSLGFAEDGALVQSLTEFRNQLEALAQRGYKQSEVLEDFLSLVRKFLQTQLGLVYSANCAAAHALYGKIAPLFEPKPLGDVLLEQLVDPVPFNPSVEFFRTNATTVGKAEVAEELQQLRKLVRIVYMEGMQPVEAMGRGKAVVEKREKKPTAPRFTKATVDFDFVTEQAATLGIAEDSLSTAVASLEFLGLIKRPGVTEYFQGNVKLRKTYKDSSLVSD